MAYIVPRVLINQEFTQQPVFGDQPLAALVFGPQFNLYRYSVDSEKPFTVVSHPTYGSAYQNDTDVTYGFPNQVLGTRVDKSFVKVHFDKAEVEYFPNDLASTAATVTQVAVPNTSKFYPNRFKASALVFKTANGVDRSADFSERDVKPGDVVVLSSATAGTSATVKVKALHASKSASAIANATADADNTAARASVLNNAVEEGDDNTSVATAAIKAGSTFVGGWVNGAWVGEETFVVTVKASGNMTTATFDISSVNGLAGTEDRTAALIDDATDSLAVLTSTGNDVKIDFAGSTSFVAGDTFTVTVRAAVTGGVLPTKGGTYTGANDLVYKLTVVRGGPFFDPTANSGAGNADVCARIAVTSNNIDSSATTNVRLNTAFNVGSYGVTATFASGPVTGGLIDGDIYYIAATASKPAATDIIETYETLPSGLTAATQADWTITSLRLVKSYEVNQLIPGNDVDLNWEVDEASQTITINGGITTADSSILNGADLLQLNVVKATVYVEHRDLVIDNSISIGSLNSTAAVEDLLGTVHPDNPLAQGVYDALLNSGGVSVYFAGVPTNDLDGYNAVLGLAKKKETYYGLVPLTFDRQVIDAVVGHVNAESTAEKAHWRKAWVSFPIVTEELIYDLAEDTDPYVGTITDDPLSAATAYTLLTVANAQFVTDGVRATDKVLINFRTDASGQLVSDEYTVAEVRTETSLVLTSGPAAAINGATKVQIKRVFTKDEQIDKLALVGGDFNNRRVNAVFPGKTKNVSIEKDGYFLAAALAGLRSGVVPHQGLTNTELLGFTDLTDAVLTFSEDQLNRLAEEGFFIVTQDTVGSTPYVRHQLTTDGSSLNMFEDSITSNVDSISYGLRRALAPFIGQYNVNPDTIMVVSDAIYNELRFRQTGTYTARAGNQLIDFEIIRVEQNATFKDRIDVEVRLQVPYPINFITVTLLV